jgi:hypothetical protein
VVVVIFARVLEKDEAEEEEEEEEVAREGDCKRSSQSLKEKQQRVIGDEKDKDVEIFLLRLVVVVVLLLLPLLLLREGRPWKWLLLCFSLSVAPSTSSSTQSRNLATSKGDEMNRRRGGGEAGALTFLVLAFLAVILPVAFRVPVLVLLPLLVDAEEKEEGELALLLQLSLLMLRPKMGGFPSLFKRWVGAWMLNTPLLLLLRREVSVKSLAHGLLVEMLAVIASIATGAVSAPAAATADAMIEASFFNIRGENEGTRRAGERKLRSSGLRG